VAGIGEQRHRIGENARRRLGDDEADVERDADGEGAAEIGRRVRVDMCVAMRPVNVMMSGQVAPPYRRDA
jgi:hypothetical protein